MPLSSKTCKCRHRSPIFLCYSNLSKTICLPASSANSSSNSSSSSSSNSVQCNNSAEAVMATDSKEMEEATIASEVAAIKATRRFPTKCRIRPRPLSSNL